MSSPASNSFDSVVSLWRYPVKSMMGEELNSAVVSSRGILGDRVYALVDNESGQVVSAKNPKKWPGFFFFRAAYVKPILSESEIPAVWITLPDGKILRSDQPDIDLELSNALPRPVSLKSQAPAVPIIEQYHPDLDVPAAEAPAVTQAQIAADAPAGTFFDYAMVHLVTTASLERLRELYPRGRFEARRFRPNIIVALGSGVKDFVENDWVGHTLSVGDEVKLQVTDPCPRCVMTTLPQGDLPKDPGILRAVVNNNVYVPFAEEALPSVGVYARVLQGGTIRRGDTIVVH
jgi:MOSC domain-containing protein